MYERIKQRRDELAAQFAQMRLAYADMETQRDQTIRALAELDRQLCAVQGGLQELDALLAPDAPAEPPP